MEFSYNQKSHATQTKSPFYLIMGNNPKAIPTAFPSTNVPEAKEQIQNLQKAWDEAIAAHELARQKMMEWTTHKFKPFQQDNLVWLESKKLKLWYESKKVAPKREGPFHISKVLGPLTYKLKLPEQWKIYPVFHATLLTPFKINNIHGPNYLNPPPDLINREPEYEVEAINAHRRQGRGYLYLIKWKDYLSVENTWEPEWHLSHARDVLKSYKNQHHLHWKTPSI